MAKDKFDTLSAARSLGTAGIEDEQAEAIVGAIRLAVSDLVTVERFKAGLAELRTHTDTRVAELRTHTDTRVAELRAHTDSLMAELRAHTNIRVAELRADNWRARLALAGVIVGANALMLTVAGYVLAAVLGVPPRTP